MSVPAVRFAILLLLLCLAGCTSRTPGKPLPDRAAAEDPSLAPSVSTSTPTATPTLASTPTPTPSLTVSGDYDYPAVHADGRYELQLSGTRVAATFATSRSPVEHWVRQTVPQPLFTIPEPFRPPYPIRSRVEGIPVHADGSPDPTRSAPHRFQLRVDPDGTVHYVDNFRVDGAGHLAYVLHTVWDAAPPTTPTVTPTPTFAHAVQSPIPSLTVSGVYENPVEHADGRYELQLAGARVAASFATSRSPVQRWAKEVPQPLFTVPEPFRPPFSIVRTAEGMPVLVDGTPDPARTEPHRFLLRVDPDETVHYVLPVTTRTPQLQADPYGTMRGAVRYVDDAPVEDAGEYLAYTLHTVWGTTPAANDRTVLEILDAHWFRKTLLSAEPPPVQFEVPEHIWGYRAYEETRPAARVGAFVMFDAAGRVTALGAPTNEFKSGAGAPVYNFNGPLPAELGQLHRLEHLDLEYREFWFKPSGPPRKMEYGEILARAGRLPAGPGPLTGALPPQLGQLTRLRHLDLSGHLLTGTLPPELGHLASLEYLDLGDNWLTGSLPSEMGRLSNLQHLDLSYNLFSGSLPPELGQLAGLQTLNLNGNELTVLPPELGQLAGLQQLYLNGNELTVLPPELGQLADLQTLNLNGNELTVLPPELGQLAGLQQLYLNGNELTILPPELGQLAGLQTLYLNYNELTVLPPELGQLAGLQTLNLSYNRLTKFPPVLGQLASLEHLDLSDNRLTALLPELGQLARLQTLYLQSNRLTGPLPPEWGQLTSLVDLDLSRYVYPSDNPGNQLTGPLPPEWGQLANLEWLDLGGNQLTGPLPPEWGQLANLERLDLGVNQLTGSLPPEWGQLANLENLYLGVNQLTGSLPPEWGQLASLEWLGLQDNQLTGSLPLEWTRMTNLKNLTLQNNQLTGCYPRIYFPNLTYNDGYISTDLPHCPTLDYIYYYEFRG